MAQIQVGDRFTLFYGNGQPQKIYGTDIPVTAYVSRISNASFWYTSEHNNVTSRVSRKTFFDAIQSGIFRKI